MAGFLYICEYLGITPMEFFDTGAPAPQKTREIAQALDKLTAQQADHVLLLVKDLTEK